MAYDAGPTPVVLRRATGSAPDDTTTLDLYVEGDLGGSSGPAEVAINPSGVRVPLKVDANGGLLLAGGGTGGTVEVDFSATNALLAQVRTAVQALLGADSPVPTAQLTALTGAISAAQTAIVAAQGGSTAATQSVLSALGPLQTEVVAVRTAVSAANSAEATRDAATDVILGGLGSKLDVLNGTVAGLQSALSVTLKPETITALSQGIRDNLSPLFSALVDAVEDSAGGTDAAVVAAVQQVRDALTAAGGDTLATIVSALRTEDASRGTQAHTDAQALLSAALRTAVKLEAGLSITSPVTLDSAAMAALAPLSNLAAIASSTAASATAAGQATQATKLDALKAATDAVTARLGQTLAVADSRLVFDGSGRLTVAMDTSPLATATGQASQLAKLEEVRAAVAAGGGSGFTSYDLGPVNSGNSFTGPTATLSAPVASGIIVIKGTNNQTFYVEVSTDNVNWTSTSGRYIAGPSQSIGYSFTNQTYPVYLEVDLHGVRYVRIKSNPFTAIITSALLLVSATPSGFTRLATDSGLGTSPNPLYINSSNVLTVNVNSGTVNLGSSGVGGSATNPLYASIISTISRARITTAALAAGGSFSGGPYTSPTTANQVMYWVNADQAGTMQVSGQFATTENSLPLSAPMAVNPDTTSGPTVWTNFIPTGFGHSIKVTNGSTAQTRLSVLLVTIGR